LNGSLHSFILWVSSVAGSKYSNRFPACNKEENVNKVYKFTKEERRSLISEVDATLGLSFGTCYRIQGNNLIFGDFCEICPPFAHRRAEAALSSDRQKNMAMVSLYRLKWPNMTSAFSKIK